MPSVAVTHTACGTPAALPSARVPDTNATAPGRPVLRAPAPQRLSDERTLYRDAASQSRASTASICPHSDKPCRRAALAVEQLLCANLHQSRACSPHPYNERHARSSVQPKPGSHSGTCCSDYRTAYAIADTLRHCFPIALVLPGDPRRRLHAG